MLGGSGVAQRFSAKDDTLVSFQGQGDNSFVEVYNGLNRQYRVSRLNASTRYLFRLAAINGMGKRCYIWPSVCKLSRSQTVASFNYISPSVCILSHSQTIASFNYILPVCRLSHSQTIASFNYIWPSVCRLSHSQTIASFCLLSVY